MTDRGGFFMDIKIGLIGFGFMGRTHSWCVDNLKYFYNDLPFNVSFKGVCTSKPETADKAAAISSTAVRSDSNLLPMLIGTAGLILLNSTPPLCQYLHTVYQNILFLSINNYLCKCDFFPFLSHISP